MKSIVTTTPESFDPILVFSAHTPKAPPMTKIAQSNQCCSGLINGDEKSIIDNNYFENGLFEKRSTKLLMINSGYQLVNIIVFTIVLILWR
ncbi:DUF1761 domain-containing protein [bacterium BMS3Abin03]|nr:DUF1761 domain-containing protein [bacterium BMS3Abin03]